MLLVVAALGALAYGMASAALANQAREAQRAVVMTIAGAFAAGFEESALGQEAEMRESVLTGCVTATPSCARRRS